MSNPTSTAASAAPPALAAPRPATEATAAANARVLDALPFGDRQDYADAADGLVRVDDPLVIEQVDADGRVVRTVWDLPAYDFLQGDAPPEVNPSLWRQAQLNLNHGLFEVAPGIYQVRGYDLANVTFVEGRTGWIAIDPLTAEETCRAALALLHAYRGDAKPVVAVIFTHSHVDHFAGVKGLFPDGVPAGLEVYAPAGFLEHAVSENVIAGNVMNRRATYMYGNFLPKGPRGQVDAGLGKATAAGTRGLMQPTVTVARDRERLPVDGVEVEFMLTQGAEAPSEMIFFFEEVAGTKVNALCMAEDTTATLHNLYTLRGAQVRDALAWSKYISAAVERFGKRTDVLFTSHHWPRRGNAQVVSYLKKQRDLYKYIHDQTLRLANQGYTMVEIAEMVALPPSLANEFYNRSYYGTVSHNVKAVYQRYIGWYDGNPANLHPLPPVEASLRYVDYMGGADAVLARARQAFDDGDYRWVAQVVNHVVFADPGNAAARALQADALEQLGYQAESAPWRNEYLSGAFELRNGKPDVATSGDVNPDIVQALTPDQVFDFMGVHLDGPRAADQSATLNFVFTPSADGAPAPEPDRYVLTLENATLTYVAGSQDDAADATYTVASGLLYQLVTGAATIEDLVASGEIRAEGDVDAFARLLALCDRFTFWFDIVTP